MPFLTSAVPRYRLHRPSGQAVVTLSGETYYLGRWRSKASRLKYDQLICEWLERGRRAPQAAMQLTVVELMAAFMRHARMHYVKNGRPTGEIDNFRYALRPLKALYGDLPVAEFGPLRLKAVRTKLVESGLSRGVINSRVARIKRMFRWGVGEELVPPAVYHALAELAGLQKGRTEARETEPVQPVDAAVVDATLPHLSPVVADMVRFQRLTGCRPAEVCLLRSGDVERGSDIWTYRPASHKAEHHDMQRVIFIGPQAQAVLAPYLLRDPEAYCFSPAESERLRKQQLRAARKTKVQPSQRDRSRPRAQRKPRDHYDPASYLTAVHRACDKAFSQPQGPLDWQQLGILVERGTIGPRDMLRRGKHGRWKRLAAEPLLVDPQAVQPDDKVQWFYQRAIPRWSPGQLRHTAASEIRRQFGLEAAQVVLGHRKADTTQIYAERDLAKAAAVMREVG